MDRGEKPSDDGFTKVKREKTKAAGWAKPPPPAAKSSRTYMMYRDNMILLPGKGKALHVSARALLDLSLPSGEGTAVNPYVYWAREDVETLPAELVADCEKLVRSECRRFKHKWAVIRGEPHTTTRTRDSTTNEIIMINDENNPGRQVPLRESLDQHLTVYLGHSAEDCQLQGHIFLNVINRLSDEPVNTLLDFIALTDGYKNRILKIKGKMAPKQRLHIPTGHTRCSAEYFEYGRALSSIPRNVNFLKEITTGRPVDH